MANLDVQPKKKSGSVLAWILLVLGVLALIYFLARGRNNGMVDDHASTLADSTQSSRAASDSTLPQQPR